jgi:hypothetical protein
MATVTVARSASGISDIANPEAETRDGAQPALSTRTEIDVVARTLCAVSMHTTLSEALLSFYASLDPAEARERSSLVLDRMQKILPRDLAGNLQQTGSYARPWAGASDDDTPGTGSRRLSRFALPALYLIGMVMLVLSVVGSITTIHYLLGR